LCSAQTFSYPLIPGTEVLSLQASQVSNITQYIPDWYYYNHGGIAAQNLNFCNVTVTYKHTDKHDSINVGVFLPIDSWNGRSQGIGGNGYTAGLTDVTKHGMIAAAAEGYIAISTDGGHTSDDPAEWALLDDRTPDYDTIYDFGILSLSDAALIGKSLTESAYGSKPKYSYWTGCSQGGRQGLALAQKYPNAYDGVVASAPAINWPELSLGGYWAQFVMGHLDEYLFPCEINTVTAAAVFACDGADGVLDGINSDPDSCIFNPFTMVGTQIYCSDTGSELKISAVTTNIVNATWTGARDSQGRFLWYGFEPGTPLTGRNTPANTECVDGKCTAVRSYLHERWAQVFVEQNVNHTLSNITRKEYDRLFWKSVQQWTSAFGTNDPDLSKFRDASGRMLTYHGLVSCR
jgi:feruloyl esterase